MTLEQIIQLGNMGYTKEDIEKLQAPAQPVQAPAQPVQPVQPAQPVQSVQPVQAPAQPVQATSNVDFLEALKLLGQQIAQPVQAPAQPVQAQAQPVQAQAQPVQAQAQPAQTPQISLSAEDLVKLTQGIAVQTAAGSIETPKSSNEIILSMLDAYENSTKKED